MRKIVIAVLAKDEGNVLFKDVVLVEYPDVGVLDSLIEEVARSRPYGFADYSESHLLRVHAVSKTEYEQFIPGAYRRKTYESVESLVYSERLRWEGALSAMLLRKLSGSPLVGNQQLKEVSPRIFTGDAGGVYYAISAEELAVCGSLKGQSQDDADFSRPDSWQDIIKI